MKYIRIQIFYSNINKKKCNTNEKSQRKNLMTLKRLSAQTSVQKHRRQTVLVPKRLGVQLLCGKLFHRKNGPIKPRLAMTLFDGFFLK